MKNRLRYLFTAFLLAYIFGWQAYWLVFDITIDPAWGALMVPSFSILFTYAVIKYDLLDIRIIAKKALTYSLIVIVVGILIVLVNLLNNYIITNVPNFPIWIFPLLLSIIVVTVGIIIWNQLKQGDVLKSEFITTVTHKFRTPLTHIKWASENLAKQNLDPDSKTQVEYIQGANTNLVELTNLLVNISENESGYSKYNAEKIDVSDMVGRLINEVLGQYNIRSVSIKSDLEKDIFIVGDERRLKFAFQALIENAVHYSGDNSSVLVSLKRDAKKMLFSVKDNGIGISKDEHTLLFSKFHRSESATHANTEGMGIGLYITKGIVTRHKGKIWAESEGANKGSTFFIELGLKD